VTRIDRLARSMKDLQDIVRELKGRGVALRATEQPVDTGTAAGKASLDMLGVFAEFETNLRRERQLEGIALAKTRGVYKGRKPSIDAAEVRRLRHEEKLGPAAIARRLGIGRTSVYRAEGFGVCADDVARLSPLGFDHINMLGRYAFILPDQIARGELRPLRDPAITDDES
jgi:DNA invertase Pin-like site-specific DNA recombinase